MSDINSLIDKATSSLLLDIDWDTTLQIVDLIRQGDIIPKNAITTLISKFNDPNPNVVLLALQVLESIVKNCGSVVHEYVATREFMEELMELLKRSSNEDVQKRVLLLLSGWVYAFRSEPKYRVVQDTVNILKAEGHHIPTVTESDAMFTADSAPIWADGGCCHRCRTQFTMLRRKHHCRACGQVFCAECSSKTSTIPKFGIEREVRVCEHCYDEINNAQNIILKPKTDIHESNDLSNQKPQTKTASKKSAEELQEEEELQLALALSKSEAENREKEKLRSGPSDYLAGSWQVSPSSPKLSTNVAPQEKDDDPELAKYLNRSFWENKQKNSLKSEIDGINHGGTAFNTVPSAPATTNKLTLPSKTEENGNVEEVDEFVSTLRSQLEIFVNRMKSNQSRGRPIANDTAVQSLFMNITAMHAQLLTYIQEQDRKRIYCEQLQDKISQIRDARAALDALREEHRDKVRREREEQERIRQIQMMEKLEIMRKKKQEYLEYQRQLALHRMAESERQILSAQQHHPVPHNLGGQPSYGPVPYPPQGYAPPPQAAPFGYPPPGESGPQSMMPSFPMHNQPNVPGAFQRPPLVTQQQSPPNTDYAHYPVQGPPGVNIPPYAPSQHGTSITPSQGPPSVDPAAITQPLPKAEEQTELITFD